MSILRLTVELIQLLKSVIRPYHHRYEYLLDLSNWLEVPSFLTALIFAVSSLSSPCLCVQVWQWNVGIVSVLLAWSSLVVLLRKLEVLGTY